MDIKIKKIKNKTSKAPEIPSQKEIIKRINKFTRKSYKYFELLCNRV